MYLEYRNINEAFRGLVQGIYGGSLPTRKRTSRNGYVLRFKTPAIITYTHPRERVLFNQARDVNPFSLLYESLWTLAGREDVSPLTYYTKRMGDYSDDGQTWHGAYGYRWREFFNDDQLVKCISLLKKNHDSRRVVLTMWDAEADLLQQREDGKDYPCNTHTYIEIQDEKLNLTICNRSNDLVWGLLGTNYVVFSFLQEYMAAHIGVEVGVYNQFSNNLHCYETNWKPKEWLECEEGEAQRRYHPDLRLIPLVRDPEAFDEELPIVVEHFDGTVRQPNPRIDELTEPFFRKVAGPILRAFELHKTYRETATAIRMCDLIQDDAWRLAATQWLKRRQK